MPTPRRVTCRDCSRHIDECGPLSSRGKCEDCGTAALMGSAQQLVMRRGPYYQRWLEGQAKRLEDELRAAGGDG